MDFWELFYHLRNKMASARSYLKPFRPILIMIFLLLVGFLTYITATDEPDDNVNDFAEFETEGDEEEEEETETQGTSDQDEDDEGLISLMYICIYLLYDEKFGQRSLFI